MNSQKIKSLLSKRCGRTFLGVFPIDRLPDILPPRRPLLLVCNTAKHDQPGDHWIVLYIDIRGEYFDSFGRSPEPTFQLYLDKYCNSYIFNDKVLQSVLSAFCGYYALFYSLMKTLNYSLRDITNAFDTDTSLNDFLVHKFVCDAL